MSTATSTTEHQETTAGPRNLTPPPPQPAIQSLEPIKPPDEFPSDDKVVEALSILGLTKLDRNLLKAFRDCGEYFKGRGVFVNIQGEAFVARHLLLATMQRLSGMVGELPADAPPGAKRNKPITVSAMCQVTTALAMGVSKITESHKLMLRMEPHVRPETDPKLDQDEPPKNKSFPNILVQVNNNPSNPAPVEPKKPKVTVEREMIGDVPKMKDAKVIEPE